MGHCRAQIVRDEMELFKKEYSLTDLLEDKDIFKMAIDVALLELDDAKDMCIIYGLCCLKTSDTIDLIKIYVDDSLYSTEAMNGSIKKINEDEINSFFLFRSDIENLFPETLTINISTDKNKYRSKICFHGHIFSYSTKKESSVLCQA